MREIRILVAEDNPFISDLVREGLKTSLKQAPPGTLGFKLDSAGDGQRALELLDKGSYDLLICDVMMPVIDGPELIRRLRAHPRLQTTKVLAMSAGGAAEGKRALAAGADLFLEKPMPLAKLRGALFSLLKL